MSKEEKEDIIFGIIAIGGSLRSHPGSNPPL